MSVLCLHDDSTHACMVIIRHVVSRGGARAEGLVMLFPSLPLQAACKQPGHV